VNDPQSLAGAVKEADRLTGDEGLGALVNNAGIAVGGPMEFVTSDAFELQMKTNVVGPFRVTQAFLPLLRKHANTHGGARVVNMSSVSGLAAFPFVGPYAASKFALEAMTEAWRHELADAKIHFSLIEPGPIKTPIWEKTREKLKDVKNIAEIEAAYPGYARISEKIIGESQEKAIEAERVAALVHKALTVGKPRLRYPIGPGSRVARLRKYVPDFIWEILVKSELKRMRK
jgi:NAD(P)-dependent dehydrogenase (short-subunit alcohol dehydrogenase family)